MLRERAIRKMKLNPDVKGVGVTFTKDAAKELESRILLAYPEAAGRFTVGTFHSLCKRQLNAAGKPVNLISEAQQDGFIRRAMYEVNGNSTLWSFAQIKEFIDDAKSQLDPVLKSEDEDPRVSILRRYETMLKHVGGMDFADMLLIASKGMETGEVKPMECGWMLIDEFQDTDMVQLRWALAHHKQGVEITVVGDDDQCVYSWRSALGHAGLKQFQQLAHAAHFQLNTTYRCPQEVITPAARLIAQNRERIFKQLRTENLSPGRVRKVVARDRDDEIERVVEQVLDSGRPEDWGILARTNKMLDLIEKRIANRFPVTRSNSKSFWDLKLPSVFLGFCRSITRDDMVGVDSVLRMAGVDEKRIGEIHNKFDSRERGSLGNYLADKSNHRSKHEALFAELASDWRSLTYQGNIQLALDGISKYMCKHLELVDKGAKGKDELIQKYRDHINASAKVLGALKGGLSSRIRAVEQPKEDKEDELSVEGDGQGPARLMTFHGAKGLEFESVWMLGCEAGVIPAKGSPIEEERRLFYVGMTRAKRNLYMSYSDGTASTFLVECGVV